MSLPSHELRSRAILRKLTSPRFLQTCPSNEGSDSGHESNVSPKIAKISMRSRPQVQCESSGYESVVSFTSSLDSEVGVKLVREDPEELHDPGGQSGKFGAAGAIRLASFVPT